MSSSNRRAWDKLTKQMNKDLQRSARRNIKPIPLPVEPSDRRGRVAGVSPPPQHTQIVNGPLIQGDSYGQMAWGNTGPVAQHQSEAAVDEPTAQDLATLAELTHQLLTEIAAAETAPETAQIEEDPTSGPGGLGADEEVARAVAGIRADASALWAETQQLDPDHGRVTTLAGKLKAALPGLASGIVSSSIVEAFTSIPW